MSPNAIASQCLTRQSQSKRKTNPATSTEVVLPPNSGRVSTSPTHHLPISVNSKPEDLKNMSLQQFLAFVPLEDCPTEPAQVPLTGEHLLSQKVMIYANPDFWDHLPANKSGAWNRFSQNNLKYMVKHKYGMELQLRESATITADHRQLLEFRSVAQTAINTARTAMKNEFFAQSIYPCMSRLTKLEPLVLESGPVSYTSRLADEIRSRIFLHPTSDIISVQDSSGLPLTLNHKFNNDSNWKKLWEEGKVGLESLKKQSELRHDAKKYITDYLGK
jgi:hypothetical protein